MCKAVEEYAKKYAEEYAEKREIRVMVETYRECSLEDEIIVTKIMEKYNLTEEQAKEYVYDCQAV